MGKVLSILIGLVFIALGVVAIVYGPSWQEAVVRFLQGGAVILALVVGLALLALGLSDLRAGAEEPPAVAAPPAAESGAADQPSAEAESGGSEQQ